MKHLFFVCFFLYSHHICYSKGKSEFLFKYYDIVVSVDIKYFIVKSGDNICASPIELSEEFKNELSNIFLKHCFDNYGIIDFIKKLSKSINYEFNINTISCETCLLNTFNFKFVTLRENENYVVGIATNMLLDKFVHISGIKYYLIENEIKYDSEYRFLCESNGTEIMSFRMTKKWDIEKKDTIVQKYFLYEDSIFNIEYRFNTYLMDYLANIPFSFSDTFFEVPTPSSTMVKNIEYIKTITNNFPTEKKIDFLLSLCQQVFYKSDIDAFSKEKLNLPEVTLYANMADCEDKSLLFSFLVWHIIGLKSILISYPNAEHMNVGIEYEIFNKNKNYLTVNGKNYLICDPSALWYSIGDQMDEIDTSLKRYIHLKFY